MRDLPRIETPFHAVGHVVGIDAFRHRPILSGCSEAASEYARERVGESEERSRLAEN